MEFCATSVNNVLDCMIQILGDLNDSVNVEVLICQKIKSEY